ncbi:unnamed protein product [Amoebophrya sp. A120]|nr:unnamed protein product [Amoebophrya sp. A120]|eukprot:GSA120T00023974001.1
MAIDREVQPQPCVVALDGLSDNAEARKGEAQQKRFEVDEVVENDTNSDASSDAPFDLFAEDVDAAANEADSYTHTEIISADGPQLGVASLGMIDDVRHAKEINQNSSGPLSGSRSSSPRCSTARDNLATDDNRRDALSLSLRINPSRSYVWPSARLLAEFLLQNPAVCAGQRVVELGCGLGLPSFAAAACGAAYVLATDFCERYLRTLEAVRSVNGKFSARQLDTQRVDWFDALNRERKLAEQHYDEDQAEDEQGFEWKRQSDENNSSTSTSTPCKVTEMRRLHETFSAFDVCLCADVNYNPNTVEALRATVRASGAEVVVLISRERRAGFDDFAECLREDFEMCLLDRCPVVSTQHQIGTTEDERHSLFLFAGRRVKSVKNKI